MGKKKHGWFYAVKKGRKTGIFSSYEECQPHVKGYSGAVHQSFPNRALAEAWLNAGAPAKQVQQQQFTPSQSSYGVNGYGGADQRSFHTGTQAEGWQAQQQQFTATQQTYGVSYSSLPETAAIGSAPTAMRTYQPGWREEEHWGLSSMTQRTPPIVNSPSSLGGGNGVERYGNFQQAQGRAYVTIGAEQGIGQCTTPPALERNKGMSRNSSFMGGDSEGLLQPLERDRHVNHVSKKQKKCQNLFIFRLNPHDPERVRANMEPPATISGLGSMQANWQSPAYAREPSRPTSSSANMLAISPSSAARLNPESLQAFRQVPGYAREPSRPSSSSADMLATSATSTTPLDPNMMVPTYTRNPPQPSSSTVNMPVTAVIQQGVYTVEYDGAAKGNPGPAGAGALLRAPSGEVVREIMVGLGHDTNNVAEYRGVIAGLTAAFRMGVQHLSVQGDSDLVCKQVKGIYKVNKERLRPLCNEVKWLMLQFASCEIKHVQRAFNSAADALANRAVHLPEESFVSLIPVGSR